MACTGLHGANRLASNSLLEGAASSPIARARHIVREPPPAHPASSAFRLPEWKSGDAQDVDELVVIYHNWDEIRRLMWDYVGIVRTDKRLQRARDPPAQSAARDPGVLLELHRSPPTCSNCATSPPSPPSSSIRALRRKESRGLHYTLDYPVMRDELFRQDTF